MRKKYILTFNVVTTVLLCFSFLLDFYICNNTDNVFIKLFSGGCFLFLIPCILLYMHIKNATKYIALVNYEYIKLLTRPVTLILILGFFYGFIPDYNIHPVIYFTMLSIEYIICAIFIVYFIQRFKMLVNARVNKGIFK